MSTTCASCGGPVEESTDRCPRCGQGTTRRYFTGTGGLSRQAPPPDVELPLLVHDVRYTSGDVWTHGQMYLTDLGVYFLAEADGPWTPERLLMIVPPDPSQPRQFAPGSNFLPLNHIEKFQHSRITSYAIFTREGKKPIRMDHDGWRLIDGYGAKVGIPTA